MKKTKTIIAAILSTIIFLFLSFCAMIVAAFYGSKLWFLIPAIGILLVIFVSLLTYGLDNKCLSKPKIFGVLAAAIVCFLAIEVEGYYKNKYLPSITVGQQNKWGGAYLPFQESPYLSRLDSPSTLKFTKDDELPVIDGATALFPVYCSFAEAVYPSDCEINDFVRFRSTKGAYEKLIEGKDDIIFVAQPSKEQLQAAKDAGVELNLHPIGMEAFVFIVNKKNPVNDITIQQIKDIYSGKTTNWKELGGKNQKIRPFQREKNSGSQTAFLALMGKDTQIMKAETHQVIDGMGGLINAVADYQNHSNAIGYSFRYYVETMVNNKDVKILSLNGIEPTKENISEKKYPIADNFYAITVKGRESENAKAFIKWIQSAQGQELVQKVGYIPLSK